MSLLDQEWAFNGTYWVINGAAVLGFFVGWWMQSFKYTLATIALALLVCHLLYIPNWRQNPDEDCKWVDNKKMEKYYAGLEDCLDEVDPRTKGKRTAVRPSDAKKEE